MNPKSKERQEAIALGKTTYFTGRPCKHGHISERRVSNQMCLKCCKEIHHITDRNHYRNPDNTLRRQLHQRQQAAKKNGIPFDITFDEIEKPDLCPIFGVKLNYGCSETRDGKQTRDPNKASIDKVVPELGYVSGNVRVISWRANNLKSNASIEELEKILDYMKRNKQNGQAV